MPKKEYGLFSSDDFKEPTSAELEDFEQKLVEEKDSGGRLEEIAKGKNGSFDDYWGAFFRHALQHEILNANEEKEYALRMENALKDYKESLTSIGLSSLNTVKLVDNNSLRELKRLFRRFNSIHGLIFQSRKLIPKLFDENVSILSCGRVKRNDLARIEKNNMACQRKILSCGPDKLALNLVFDGNEAGSGIRSYLLRINDAEKSRNSKEMRKKIAVETGTPFEEFSYYLQTAEKSRNEFYKQRDAFVGHNLKFVLSETNKIAHRYYGHYTDIKDLFSVGTLGLLTAVEYFNPGRGYKLSTYAQWWIRQAILRTIADTQGGMRIPVHTGELINKINYAVEELQKDDDSSYMPEPEEIQKLLPEMSAEKIARLMKVSRRTISLDKEISDYSEDTLYRTLPDTAQKMPYQEAHASDLQPRIAKLLNTLDGRSRNILELRFGFRDGGRKYTLEEVGAMYHITRERIRQIEAKALRKLRYKERLNSVGIFTAEAHSFVNND